MYIRYSLILLFFQICASYRPSHQVNRQCKSIFSNKRYQETFTPARYCAQKMNINVINPAIGEKILPEQTFPEMECPTNIMDTYKSFFGNADTNTFLRPFPNDVKASFKNIMEMNKNTIQKQTKAIENDFFTNVKTYTPEKINSGLQNEEHTHEVKAPVESGKGEVLETEKNDTDQETMSANEDATKKEVEINIVNNIVEISNSKDTQIDFEAEDSFQSWESVQYSSELTN